MTLPTDVELVFAASNLTRTEIKWRNQNAHGSVVRGFARLLPKSKVKRRLRGKRLVGVSDTSGYEGICGALCCAWLQASHQAGTGHVSSAGALGGMHKLAIAQATYTSATAHNQGMSWSERLDKLMDIFDLQTNDSGVQDIGGALDDIVSYTGRFLLQLYFGEESHFVGCRAGGTDFFFFEPYEGLYSFATANRFKTAIKAHLDEHYGLAATDELDWRETRLQ